MEDAHLDASEMEQNNHNNDEDELMKDDTHLDASATSGPSANTRGSYRQRYKRSWELEPSLRGWLGACPGDDYAAYCKYCRTKLHAHKKGLVTHAKSTKHKKHITDSSFLAHGGDGDLSDLMAGEGDRADASLETNGLNEDQDMMTNGNTLGGNDTTADNDSRSPSSKSNNKNRKSYKIFNDDWLLDPNFSRWLRRVPANNTKALCIACRCVIGAGRSELLKHGQAVKHRKALVDGPLEEISSADLSRWLDAEQQQLNQSGIISRNTARSSTIALQRANNNISGNAHTAVATFNAATMIDTPGMMLEELIKRLTDHIPLELAEKWDNVGFITRPTSNNFKVHNVLLTIDLNVKIVEEALKRRSQMIISYHPPIFTPIKRLNPNNWKDRAILMCIENKITVYSPHTALDAIKGGINDWLVSSFMNDDHNKIRPVYYSNNKRKNNCLEMLFSESLDTVTELFQNINNVTITNYGSLSTGVRVTCDDQTLPKVIEHIAQHDCPHIESRVMPLVDPPMPGVGMGRVVEFANPLPLYEVVHRTKSHLDLTYIRLAMSPLHTRETKIKSIAVCAGSGSSVLKDCSADLWITGEMSHHEVLDATNKGLTVILCEHSNTERGFLRDWSNQLAATVLENKVAVYVSDLDKDPLKII